VIRSDVHMNKSLTYQVPHRLSQASTMNFSLPVYEVCGSLVAQRSMHRSCRPSSLALTWLGCIQQPTAFGGSPSESEKWERGDVRTSHKEERRIRLSFSKIFHLFLFPLCRPRRMCPRFWNENFALLDRIVVHHPLHSKIGGGRMQDAFDASRGNYFEGSMP
jgi:hypothetical protein